MTLVKNKNKYKKLMLKYLDTKNSIFYAYSRHKVPQFKLYYKNQYIYFKAQEDLDLCYNEIICHELAKKMNIKSVEYAFAKMKHNKIHYTGIISKDFVGKNQSFLECASFAIQGGGLNGVMKNLEKSKNIYGYKFDLDKVELDLFKIIVFDFLTCQTDRHDCNFGFLISKNNELSVAPIFDNEYSFGFTSKKRITNFFKILNLDIRFCPYNFRYLNIDNISTDEISLTSNEILSYAKNKPHLLDYIKKVIDSFNVDDLEKRLKAKNLVIPKERLDEVKKIINYKKQHLTISYSRLLSQNTKENQIEKTKLNKQSMNIKKYL